ncbi:alpha/beta hydrolase [Streptomyces sp. URMC 123]|uniref:alpha/beta hydrolase n=1 Tax=Streptomyces sp. URMC 123 TaxID=3423403 RepID=UPI003F1A0823
MKRRLAVTTALLAIGLVAGCASDEGKPLSFDKTGGATGGQAGGKESQAPKDSPVLMPTGPKAEFVTQRTTGASGTKVGVTELKGPKSGFTGKVWVWAPPEYYEKGNENTGFPVLIALPGSYGYPNNYWFGGDIKLQEKMAKWSKEGKSHPFILAMPVMNPGEQYNECSDIPGQQKMGTWMTEDVPNLVRANFRTLKSRDGWGFMGSSSGGYCGLKSVLKNPDKFKAVIASGTETVPDTPLWKNHEQEKQANNPEKLAEQLAAKGGPEVYLNFQAGTKEPDSMVLAEKFIQKYTRGPVKTRLQRIEGAKHDAWGYMKGMEQGSMKWISEHMQGPTPAS